MVEERVWQRTVSEYNLTNLQSFTSEDGVLVTYPSRQLSGELCEQVVGDPRMLNVSTLMEYVSTSMEYVSTPMEYVSTLMKYVSSLRDRFCLRICFQEETYEAFEWPGLFLPCLV